MPSFSRKFVDFSETNHFTSLVIDYLNGSGEAEKFASYPFSIEIFSEVISERKKKPVHRALLQEVIREQYKMLTGKIRESGKVQENITLLGKDQAFTITTGHQLNLFTGPLYFIYKIVSTINLASQLKQTFPQYDFIPLYWMASEDHDLEEISHIRLFGKNVSWKPTDAGASGRIMCSGISEVLEEIKGMLSGNARTEKIIGLFSRAYDEKNTLSEAHRIIVHELFSEYGLVILDPDDARLKKLFLPVMKDDALTHSAFGLVEETVRLLEKNYKAQVHPREINLFYLGKNSRERIVQEESGYRIMNTDILFSRDELLLEMENHPENFSPNVVLRPLYQEMILPDIAYVGGPAEVSYMLEYKTMFAHYGSVLPVLVLRNCALVLDASAKMKLSKFGLSAEDVFLSEDDLVKKFLKLNSSKEFSVDDLVGQAGTLFDETLKRAVEIDPTLKATVEAEKQKVINGLQVMGDRIRRAEKKKHETELSQLRKLKEKLFPENQLQERSENLLVFYSNYGEEFIRMLFSQMNPLEKKFILFVEE